MKTFAKLFIFGIITLLPASAFTQNKPSASSKGNETEDEKRSTYTAVFQDFYDLATPHNRALDTSFIVGIQFSTIVPLSGRLGFTDLSLGGSGRTDLVSSTKATFFNLQARFGFRFIYHMELFIQSGFDQIDTDVPNSSNDFQHAGFWSIPMILGFKYRFITGDFVPYVSLSAGYHYINMTVTEESSVQTPNKSKATKSKFSLGYAAALGSEFYIHSHFGLSVEVGMEYIMHGAEVLNSPVGFNKGPFQFRSKSGGILVSSSLFWEF